MKIATFVAALILVAGGNLVAAEPTLEEILKIAYASKGPDTLQAKMTMTLIDSGGKSSERTLQIRRAGNDKQIVWFEAPANMRGTGFLRLVEGGEQKMWLYLPAFKKLERIGAADEKRSFLGSDFTYADMAEHNLSRYDARLLGKGKLDETDVHHVEFNLKSMQHDVLYAKIVAYIRLADSRVVREDLYDKGGDFIKQKTYAKIEQVAGHWLPTSIEMKNMQRDHVTRLEMKDIKVNERIADRVFSTKYLEKAD